MERLTERDDGTAIVKGCGSNCKYGFEHCRNEDWENCKTIDDVIDKLAEYEDLEDKLNGISIEQVVDGFIKTVEGQTHEGYENGRILTNDEADKWNEHKRLEEQGLLLRLPCKVGTKVYAINRIIDYGEVGDEATYSYSIIEREFQIYMMMEYGELVFGKTVFLTQAEAEQKLKEMESE